MQTDNYVNIQTDIVDGYVPLNMQKWYLQLQEEASHSWLDTVSSFWQTGRLAFGKKFFVSEINIYPALLEETTHNYMS